MQRIRRFGVVQTANTLALLYFVIGAVSVVIMWLIMAAGGVPETESGVQWLGGAMLIFLPILYAAIGWVGVAIFCWLYNLVARFSGGIAMELEAD